MTTDTDILEARCQALEYVIAEMTRIPDPLAGDPLLAFLRPQARAIVGLLLSKPRCPFSRTQVLAAAMGTRPTADWPNDRIVDVHICNARAVLRGKVKITTHWGYGFSAELVEGEGQ